MSFLPEPVGLASRLGYREVLQQNLADFLAGEGLGEVARNRQALHPGHVAGVEAGVSMMTAGCELAGR